MRTIAIAVISVILFSSLAVPNSFEDSRNKSRFWGDHTMKLYGDPQIDFKVDPLTAIPYTVDADVHVGNYKINLFGGGYVKPDYNYYDKQCKSMTGFEYLFSDNGDFVRIDYHGKVCYFGTGIKSVNLTFSGSNAKGIFENAVIDGTLSGNSDRFEGIYNLIINSVLVYNNN